jgi:thiol-disulfide isomerase/thioredoxin
LIGGGSTIEVVGRRTGTLLRNTSVKISRSLLAVSLPMVALAMGSAPEESAALKFLPEGAVRKLGSYRPQRLELTAERPPTLKKAPEMAAPLFGKLTIGAKESPLEVLIAVDEPEGRPSRLYVDGNGNGDLTDDGEAKWEPRTSPGPDGATPLTMSMGGAMVRLKYGAAELPARIAMYRFDKKDPQRQALKNTILYYGDYAYEGDVALGGNTYKAMLVDDTSSGDFRGDKVSDRASVRLLLDVNENGKFESRGESFDVRKPFNIKGTTYEIAELPASGASFRIVKSQETVEELLPPLPVALGKPFPPFTAKTMEGKELTFPSSFAGKLVLLDYWATWCGPCIAELPNLLSNFDQYHDKGLEILGVSLDNAGQEAKVAAFLKDKKMTWPQVYDGKGWQAENASKYGINSIPTAFLVDGDTGEVLATGNALRGEALGATLEKAFAKKKAAVK